MTLEEKLNYKISEDKTLKEATYLETINWALKKVDGLPAFDERVVKITSLAKVAILPKEMSDEQKEMIYDLLKSLEVI